ARNAREDLWPRFGYYGAVAVAVPSPAARVFRRGERTSPSTRGCFRKEELMRARRLAILVGVIVVLNQLGAPAAEPAAKPLTVELKSFTFKARDGAADLFGYNTD